MQMALVLWGRETFSKRMGIAPKDLPEFCRKNELLPPAVNTRKKADQDLLGLLKELIAAIPNPVLNKLAQDTQGVSGTTLKLILDDHNVTVGVVKAEDLEKDAVWDTAQRTGSISLTAHIHHTTEAQLIKMGLDRKSISDPSKMGYRYRTGRLGEVAMMAALSESGNVNVKDVNQAGGFNSPGHDVSFDGNPFEDRW